METILIFTSQHAMDVNGVTLPWAMTEIQVHPIPVTPEKQFLIAYDGITDAGIVTAALQNTPVKMLYVMHHSDPKEKVLATFRAALDALKIPYEYPFLKSTHPNRDTYFKVPAIDEHYKSGQSELLELLFDDLQIQLSGDPELEAKLNILHLLLSADTLTSTHKKQLDEQIEKAGNNAAMKAAVADFKTKSNSHFDRLTTLRDQLLNEY